MRLTSDIWVSALLRSEQSKGSFVIVSKKGATEAGTIFVVHNHLDKTFSLFAPAPQAVLAEFDDFARKFERVIDRDNEDAISVYLDKQMNFDRDIWIVEIETSRDEIEALL